MGQVPLPQIQVLMYDVGQTNGAVREVGLLS